MGFLLFWAAVIGFLLWRHSLEDPQWGIKWPDRTLADPEREQALRAAVGAPAGGLSLSLSTCEWSRETGPGTQVGTRLVVSGVCPQLSVRFGGGTDVEVGDSDLDAALTLMGPPPLVRAMFDRPARRALMALARAPVRQDTFKVLDGRLQIDVAETAVDRLEPVARLLLAAAERLQAPADVPARLAGNARDDEDAAVRLSCLQTLVRDFRATRTPPPPCAPPATTSKARCGWRRRGPWAPRGVRSCWRWRATRTWTTRVPPGPSTSCGRHRRRAVAHPGDGATAPPSRTAPSRPYTARACVEALGRLGEDAVPLLEGALRSENEAVALAAIRALDRIGGPAVVMSLQAAVEHHGGEVRRAAETTLGDVQARLVGTPGQVSLTAGDTGQVSLAEDAAGNVSLPEKPAPTERPRRSGGRSWSSRAVGTVIAIAVLRDWGARVPPADPSSRRGAPDVRSPRSR
jgi:hypothetical protein